MNGDLRMTPEQEPLFLRCVANIWAGCGVVWVGREKEREETPMLREIQTIPWSPAMVAGMEQELFGRAFLHVARYKENEFRALRERVLQAKLAMARRAAHGWQFSRWNSYLTRLLESS